MDKNTETIIRYYHLNKKWYYFYEIGIRKLKYSFADKENEIGILFAENITHAKVKERLLQMFPNMKTKKIYPYREGCRNGKGNGSRSRKPKEE